MARFELEKVLNEHFPETSVVPLLNDFENMLKNIQLQKYDLVLISGGRFTENIYIALSTLTNTTVNSSPDFSKIQKELMGMPETEIPSSIRVIIPRACRVLYDLRSRRGAVHVAPSVSPNYIDASLAVSIAQWTLAEMIRIYSTQDPEEILHLIQGLVDKKLPIVEEIAGIPVILEENISARDSILILLYNRHPESIGNSTLVEHLPDFTRPNILTSLRNAEIDKLVLRDKDTNYLTAKGVHYVEKKYGEWYFGGR